MLLYFFFMLITIAVAVDLTGFISAIYLNAVKADTGIAMHLQVAWVHNA